jgi:hypothetical protein
MIINRVLRVGLTITSAIVLALAVGYYYQMPWAIQTWPWQDGRLTYIFIASILAGIGAGILWIALSHEWGHLAAGSLNLLITMGGISTFLLFRALQEGWSHLLFYILAAGLAVVINFMIFTYAHRLTSTNLSPLPKLVFVSYQLFSAILLLVGGALILNVQRVMPWPLQPETSVLIGFIFFGNAFYFLYALLRPYWQYGRAQLWSFLVYDMVLISPFMAHWASVRPELRASLLIYTVILIYSGILSAAYLFFIRQERLQLAE